MCKSSTKKMCSHFPRTLVSTGGDLINEKSLFQTQIGINLVLRKKNIWREKKYDENSLLLNLCPKKNLKTQKIDVNL